MLLVIVYCVGYNIAPFLNTAKTVLNEFVIVIFCNVSSSKETVISSRLILSLYNTVIVSFSNKSNSIEPLVGVFKIYCVGYSITPFLKTIVDAESNTSSISIAPCVSSSKDAMIVCFFSKEQSQSVLSIGLYCVPTGI